MKELEQIYHTFFPFASGRLNRKGRKGSIGSGTVARYTSTFVWGILESAVNLPYRCKSSLRITVEWLSQDQVRRARLAYMAFVLSMAVPVVRYASTVAPTAPPPPLGMTRSRTSEWINYTHTCRDLLVSHFYFRNSPEFSDILSSLLLYFLSPHLSHPVLQQFQVLYYYLQEITTSLYQYRHSPEKSCINNNNTIIASSLVLYNGLFLN